MRMISSEAMRSVRGTRPRLWTDLHSGQLDGVSRIHPRRAVQSRGGHTGDHTMAARCQPRCDRAVTQRQLRILRCVDAAVNRQVPAAQFVTSDPSRRNRFTANEDLRHGCIVHSPTDSPAESTYCSESASRPLQNVDFAKEKTRPWRGGPRARGPTSTRRRTPDHHPSAGPTRYASRRAPGYRAAFAPDTSPWLRLRCSDRSR